MLKSLIVGTLTTLNTVMTPFGGAQDPNTHFYQLLLDNRCLGSRTNLLAMRMDSDEAAITLNVQGQICGEAGTLEPVKFALILPKDLLDLAFLTKLPENSSYVVHKLPSMKSSDADQAIAPQSAGVRIKISKRTQDADGLTPYVLEWLPSESGQVEHQPVTIWLASTNSARPSTGPSAGPSAGPGLGSASKAGGPPWARIEFPELRRHSTEPVALSREVIPSYQPTTRR